MDNKAIVFILENQEYRYYVQIKINGNSTGYGRYCKSWLEVNEAIKFFNAELIGVQNEK